MISMLWGLYFGIGIAAVIEAHERKLGVFMTVLIAVLWPIFVTAVGLDIVMDEFTRTGNPPA